MSLPEKIGPYSIEASLGVGGLGEVYRAYDERLGRRVALKRLRSDRADQPGASQRLLREAGVAARLNHPCLVQVHDVLHTESGDWIVMELIEGEPLSKLIETAALPLDQFFRLAYEITSGVAAAHAAGILHRDLKSENIVATASGQVKILDFGLAGPYGSEEVESAVPAPLYGTARAMSPELALGKTIDHRSDLFSLGVLFYELLSASSPFLGPGVTETLARVGQAPHLPLAQYDPRIPQELSRLVDRLLEKDPADRPQNAQEVLSGLQQIVDALGRSSSDDCGNSSREQTPCAENLPSAVETADQVVSLSGECRQLTVLCCDLIGDEDPLDDSVSTDLFERLPALQLSAVEAIERFGGHLSEVLGHRLIACFGYPRACEDASWCAIQAALEITTAGQRRTAHLGGQTRLRPRCGIHTGPAVVLAETPRAGSRPISFGETLGLATVLQERAEHQSVLVSEATHRLNQGLFLVEPLEFSDPPGDPPQKGWRIVDANDFSQGREVSEGSPQMVGRQREVAMLLDRLALAQRGDGQTVLLCAETGLGKSRLLRELRQRAAPLSPHWLVVHGTPIYRHASFAPIGDLLRQLLELEQDTQPEHRWLRLEELLTQHEMPPSEVLPLVNLVLETPPLERAPLTASQAREICSVLSTLFLELSERRPSVVVFEDLQWMDPQTIDLISHLAAHVHSAHLLLVLTSRTETEIGWSQPAEMTRLHLSPLSPEETARLVCHLTPPGRLPDEARGRIIEWSDGVPLFVEALVHDALDHGQNTMATALRVPPALLDILLAQLDGLGAAKEIATKAAVLGREFTITELTVLMSCQQETLEDGLKALQARGILVQQRTPGVTTYRFRLHLVHEMSLAHLLPEDLEQLRQRSSGLLLGG